MPEEVFLVDRLVLFIKEAVRAPGPESDVERLSVTLNVKNPVGSPGSTRRPPNMEVWDAEGRVYPVINDDWAEPVLPDTEIETEAVFDVAADATEIELVFAPGEPDEVSARLE
jgi:hypothetical protein